MGKNTPNRPKRQTLSKQRRWQLRQLAEGDCYRCGRKRNLYANVCDACARKERLAKRKRYQLGAYKKGRRGRPPITKERVPEPGTEGQR